MPWIKINGRDEVISPDYTLNLVETKHDPRVKVDWPGHAKREYSELDLMCLLHGNYGSLEFDETSIYASALNLLRGEAPRFREKGPIGARPRPNPIKTHKKRSFLSRLWDRIRRLSN